MSKTPNDGGPAFPNSVQPDFKWAEAGMSLRDYFAGQALAGLLAARSGHSDTYGVTSDAYLYADAMLAARSLPKGG